MKYLKQEVGLSICLDEHSPCGLFITGEIKIYQCHMINYRQWRIALWAYIKELFLLTKFDNSSPSVTRDKEICQSHVIMR